MMPIQLTKYKTFFYFFLNNTLFPFLARSFCRIQGLGLLFFTNNKLYFDLKISEFSVTCYEAIPQVQNNFFCFFLHFYRRTSHVKVFPLILLFVLSGTG